MELLSNKKGFTGPSFSISNRVKRIVWQIAWFLTARWTPPPLHRWRILIIRLFGGNVSWKAYVYPNVDIWAPWELKMAEYATLGRGVICYNIAPISLAERAVVSQGAFLCTGTHQYNHPDFPLMAKPIEIGIRAWICANSFIGPGVVVADGAILGAGGVTFRNLEAWSIYVGNPAQLQHMRPVIIDEA
jgi:putative colanic acid biosynthesis acetyltransferase WcaF